MRVLRSIGILCIVLSIFSCRSNTSKNEKDAEDINFFNDTSDVGRSFREIYYRFPSPSEMFSFIDSIGLYFDQSLLLPVSKLNTFLDSKSQGLNMGVYIADLAYITLFKRYKESREYLHTLYLLGEKLNLTASHSSSLLVRIENNIQNIDSLEAIFDDTYEAVIDYLNRNEKVKVFAFVSFGGFIESLYLSCEAIGEFSEQNPTIRKLFDQKVVFENILRFASDYDDDPQIKELIEIMQPLKDFYNGLEYVEEETTVEKPSKNKLIIGGGQKLYINQEKYEQLVQIVKNTRSEITSSN